MKPFTRRQFIQTAAALSAALGVASVLPTARAGKWRTFYVMEYVASSLSGEMTAQRAALAFERRMRADGLTEIRNVAFKKEWDKEIAAWAYGYSAEIR